MTYPKGTASPQSWHHCFKKRPVKIPAYAFLKTVGEDTGPTKFSASSPPIRQHTADAYHYDWRASKKRNSAAGSAVNIDSCAGSGDPAYVYLCIHRGDNYLRKESDVSNKIRRSRDRRYIILCVLCGDD